MCGIEAVGPIPAPAQIIGKSTLHPTYRYARDKVGEAAIGTH